MNFNVSCESSSIIFRSGFRAGGQHFSLAIICCHLVLRRCSTLIVTLWDIPELQRSTIYYINTRTLCVCVHVFVISEISGTRGSNATLLAPTWRASLGELQRLLLELTWRMVREKKPFSANPRNHTLHVTTLPWEHIWCHHTPTCSWGSWNESSCRPRTLNLEYGGGT